MIVSFLVLPIRIGSVVDAMSGSGTWATGLVIDIDRFKCLLHVPGWTRRETWTLMQGYNIRAPRIHEDRSYTDRPGTPVLAQIQAKEEQGFDPVKLSNCMIATGLITSAMRRYFKMYGVPKEYDEQVLSRLRRT